MIKLFDRGNKFDELKEIINEKDNILTEKVNSLEDEINVKDHNVLVKLNSQADHLNSLNELVNLEFQKINDSLKMIIEENNLLKKEIKILQGKKVKKEDDKQYGQSNNTSGIANVCYNSGTGFWAYRKTRNGHTTRLHSADLKVLEKKVKSAGYDWIIIDEDKARASYNGKGKPKKNPSTRNIRTKDPDAKYEFPDSYKKRFNLKIAENGLVCHMNHKKGIYEPYTFIKLFKLAKFPLLNKQYNEIYHYINNSDISIRLGFSFLYSVQNGLETDNGDALEFLHSIYNNMYNVPFYINFERKEDNIYINEKDTGISVNILSDCISELNNSIHPECTIVRLMHEHQELNPKYLFSCLMNYGSDHLRELL